jgi:uncharacterized protein (DUF1778 family)
MYAKCVYNRDMDKIKTERLDLRVTQDDKRKLAEIARITRRDSMSSVVRWLIDEAYEKAKREA